jgi:hypothetical protein
MKNLLVSVLDQVRSIVVSNYLYPGVLHNSFLDLISHLDKILWDEKKFGEELFLNKSLIEETLKLVRAIAYKSDCKDDLCLLEAMNDCILLLDSCKEVYERQVA